MGREVRASTGCVIGAFGAALIFFNIHLTLFFK